MNLSFKPVIVLMALMLVFLAGCSTDEKTLIDAVKNGDTVKAQSLLDKGVNPNLKTDDGKTVLMLAAYLGHTDIAKLLIDKGADVNAKDSNGRTALMYAAEKGNIETAKLLLEKGADINAADNNGKTALQFAEENYQIEMAGFLKNWGKPAPTPLPTVAPIPTPTPEPTQTATPVTTTAPVINANRKLASIFFDFDKSVLRPDQTGEMKKDLAALKDNPDMRIIIGGHADERGSWEYNMALSRRRAETIQQYLADNGIAPERITLYAFGKDYPLEKGHDEAAYRMNRRVDILEWDTVLTKEQVIEETLK